MKKTLHIVLLCCLPSLAMANPNAPYSGQEQRRIKAFSEAEIEGYLNGRGMGLAKPAELNHFPGPGHVLDLARELALSEDQQAKTSKIYDDMRTQAMEYGRRFIEKEAEIEDLFATNTVTPSRLQALLRESANIIVKLRAAHLNAHIDQRRLLNARQIEKYDELRGYASGNGHPHHHHH